jgi:hypothetical protein
MYVYIYIVVSNRAYVSLRNFSQFQEVKNCYINYNYNEVSMVSVKFQTFGNRRVNNVTEIVETKLIYARDAQMVQICM